MLHSVKSTPVNCLFIGLWFSGQLNRPSVSVTPSDELLQTNNDELTTENDGALLNWFLSFFPINFVLFLVETSVIVDNIQRMNFSRFINLFLMDFKKSRFVNCSSLVNTNDCWTTSTFNSITRFSHCEFWIQMKRHHRIGAGGHASVLATISTCVTTKKTSMISVKNQLETFIVGTDNARTHMLNRTKQKNPFLSTHGR